jgi:L-seryl-tRNA(Ser) seleniumtransferase
MRSLPSVDVLLRGPLAGALVREHGQTIVVRHARELLDELRIALKQGDAPAPEADAIDAGIAARVQAALASSLKPVVNLSGTVIHTNLGRSPLAKAAVERVTALMGSPTNLEYDLATGARGDRDSIVERLLCELTGAEAATVVNNNAAAVVLSLFALGRGREAIVSRGELVEIGGAFRMPDVMESAGVHMVEVGTTNRTHLRDYAGAIGERTALLMKVHTSNYVIKGFTSSVPEAELAALAHSKGLPLVSDLGSGSLVDFAAHGLPREPMPQQMLRDGCDVVTFSGDKLLGGPQAGLIVGKREFIDLICKCPLKRALRVSKLPLAALEATLQLYLRPERLASDLPVLRLLTRPKQEIEQLAARLQAAVADAVAPRFSVALVDTYSQIGSGALPDAHIPSSGLALTPVGVPRKQLNSALNALAAALRALPSPVLGRIDDDRLVLDFRCLERPEDLADQLPLLKLGLLGT